MPTYRNDGQQTVLVEDVNGLAKAVAPGQSVQTYQVLTADNWTKTAVTPIWSPVLATHEIEAASAGVVEQEVNPSAGVLEVQTDVDVTIHVNAADGAGYPLPADRSIQFQTLGRISSLYINFSAPGNARVIELRE